MNYSISSNMNTENNCWEVDVTGEVDVFNSIEFKEYLLKLTETRQADIAINCKNLEYMDSTALGALVAVLKTVQAYNGKIYISEAKPSLIKLFKITSLDKIFVIEG